MPRHPQLYAWAERVATRFPDLPRHQAAAPAEWSFGMVLAHACGRTAVAVALAAVLGQGVNTARQRLRELYQPAARTAGRGRTGFDPTTCCGPLVRWITAGWADRRVALALGVTNLADRFHVLTAAVVYRGCGTPVAWAVLPANTKDPWNPHRVRLLDRVAAALGPGWAVLVLTDRGLASADLFRAITGRGFHPLMRVKAGGPFLPAGWHRFHPSGAFAARDGDRFAAAGTAYKTAPLGCPLSACRVAGCADPWVLLTDLPVGAGDPCGYAFRARVGHGFKVLKSGGWQWHRTRITAPDRADRMWAAVAVATLWLVEVGGLAECEPRPETVPPFRTAGRPRVHRVFRVGLGLILAGLLAGRVADGRFVPEPWPAPEPIPSQTEAEFMPHLTYP
ncbi:MAG: hypothetical protein JWO38_3509 [Gemmataceae bacterium]|nr:hypothetical protein [Gemmataceae bacterium]